MIEFDDLINPSVEVSDQEVSDFFKNEEFHEDQYLVQAIKLRLRSKEDKKVLYDLDVSIEELLNGNYDISLYNEIALIKHNWNRKLGFKYFI